MKIPGAGSRAVGLGVRIPDVGVSHFAVLRSIKAFQKPQNTHRDTTWNFTQESEGRKVFIVGILADLKCENPNLIWS